MPLIPTYHEQINAAAEIRNPQATGTAFGAGVARAQGQFADEVGHFGAVVGQLADHMAKVHDATRLHAAQAQVSTDLNTFVQTLENGATDADGNYVPSPPVQDHERLFADKVKQIRAAAKASLPESIYDQFTPQIDGDVGVAYLKLRKNSIVKAKDASLATINQVVNLRTAEASTLSGSARELVVAKGVAAINLAAAGGLIDRVEQGKRLQKFGHDIDLSDLVSDQRDPKMALRNLQAASKYPGLTSSERALAITQTLAFQERDDRAAQAEEAHAVLVEHKAMVARQHETAKTLVDAEVAGKLTPQLVAANSANLSDTNYRYFMGKAAGVDGTRESVPETVIDLRQKRDKGIDVSAQAANAYRGQRITHADYMTFTAPEASTEPWRKNDLHQAGARSIDLAFAAGPDTTPADRYVHSQTLTRWDNWFRDNQNATPKEAEAENTRLIRAQSSINLDTNIRSMTPPRYLEGQRTSMQNPEKLNKALADTMRAVDANALTKAEGAAEGETIMFLLNAAAKQAEQAEQRARKRGAGP